MSVTNQTPVNAFTANGVTTVFNFTFQVLDSSDLHVQVDAQDKIIGSEYTVSGVGNPAGGSVTFLSAPASGASVVVFRDSALERDTDYQNNGDLRAATVNNDFDRIWLALQEVLYGVQLAPTLRPGSPLSGTITLPDPGAGRYLRWNLAGNALEAVDGTGTTPGDFLQSGSGAVARSIQSKIGETVSVKDFGAKGDGATDDTAAIQAAISSGAKRIISPSGATYRITAMLVIAADAVVLDFRKSTITLDDATGLKSHLKLGDNTIQRNGIEVRNVTFTRVQAATAGAAIEAQYVGVAKIRGCRIYGNGKIYNGISMSRAMISDISDNYIDNCVNNGVYLVGTGTGANRTVDVTLRKNRVEGGVTCLNIWDFVEGIFCRDNIFFNSSSSCVTVNASSNANGLVSFKFQENDFDTAGGAGLYIDNVNNIQVTDNWFSNLTGICLDIGSSVDSIVVDGNQIYPINHGIRFAGTAARISDNLISGGQSCVFVRGTSNRASISGNTLCNAAYGVNMSEAPSNTHVVGNHIHGMSSGSMTGETLGTGNTVQNNKGDAGLVGNAYITVTASPFTYTAGPRPEYVSIFGGTVSQIALSGVNIGFTSNRSVLLAPGQSVTVTYSALPYMIKNLL